MAERRYRLRGPEVLELVRRELKTCQEGCDSPLPPQYYPIIPHSVFSLPNSRVQGKSVVLLHHSTLTYINA